MLKLSSALTSRARVALPLTVVAASAALTGSSALAGAAGAHTRGKAASVNLNIALLPRAVNVSYFTTAEAGAKEAASQLHGSLKFVGPTQVTAAAQLPYIQSLTEQGVSAIMLSANDPNALLPALARAKARGIKVVTFDSDTAPAGRTIFVNQATSQSIGKGLMQMMGQETHYRGEWAIIESSATSPNENAWIAAAKTEYKNPKYKNMKLVKVAYGPDDQSSYNAAVALMQAYPNLAGIMGTNTFSIAAAARAVQSAKKGGKVQVTGLGTPDQMRAYVQNGTVKEFELWDPKELGYLAYYATVALLEGKISGKAGQSFSAGKLGSRTVGAQGQVVLGPPTVFTKSNIGGFHF